MLTLMMLLWMYVIILLPFQLLLTQFDVFDILLKVDYPADRSKDKIYLLLKKNWSSYKLRHQLRDVEIREVEKMLNCKKQYFLFNCPRCDHNKIVYSTCNSRVCTSCGKKHVDKWSKQLCKRLLRKEHRHIVLTIPEQLRPYFKRYPFLLKYLMDCSREMLDYVLKETKHQDLTPAYIAVLHTFGRDMKDNPHIHLIFASGGFTNHKKWIDVKYFNYNLFHIAWQKALLEMIRKKLKPYVPEVSSLVASLYESYPKGFYAHMKDPVPANKINIKYIARYIRHPAIAASRIVSFDDKEVVFFYEDYKTRKRVYKTMALDEFITSLIGHIPNNQFKMIRYYGAYSRKSYKKFNTFHRLIESITQLKLVDFKLFKEKWAPLCEKCGTKMRCIWYSGKGSPEEEAYGEKITDWVEVLGRS